MVLVSEIKMDWQTKFGMFCRHFMPTFFVSFWQGCTNAECERLCVKWQHVRSLLHGTVSQAAGPRAAVIQQDCNVSESAVQKSEKWPDGKTCPGHPLILWKLIFFCWIQTLKSQSYGVCCCDSGSYTKFSFWQYIGETVSIISVKGNDSRNCFVYSVCLTVTMIVI